MILNVIILAAGRGKRMKSSLPKVMHPILGRPMLQYVVDAINPLKPAKTIVVIGTGAEKVREGINSKGVEFVIQKELLGTGDAVSTAAHRLNGDTILILNGDCPLIQTQTLRTLIKMHSRDGNSLSFLSFQSDTARGYGRVIRDEQGRIECITEEKHLTEAQRQRYREFNGGVYVIERKSLSALKDIKINKQSGEYYLTDIVSILSSAGKKIEAYDCPEEEIHGVNNRQELFKVSDIIRRRVIEKMMSKGVTFLDPETSIIHPSVKIGRDTTMYPNTYIEGETVIGKNCTIYPGARIINSKIGNGVTIKDNSLIEDSIIKDRASIGPFAHLRPGSIIGRKAKIGNFVEVKKSRIGDGTKASHLTYLGDAEIGRNVNIGAGTITCNYDGRNKHQTIIGSGVFVGSDAQLIAPVKIGKEAFIAAGATITKNVPSGALAISRVKQQNILGWVKRKRRMR